MDRTLLVNALVKFFLGFFIVAALLFLPAGTLHFPNAWLLICALFIPMFFAGIIMLFKTPELLRRRLNAREKQTEQKGVIAWSALLFLLCFVLAGLGFRFGWPALPCAVSRVSVFIFLAGYALFALVLRENEYLSRTVKVHDGQKVVDTGLYGIVRHPMYAATLLMFLSMPLILGSAVSFITMLGYVPILVLRIRGEERLLERELEGYLQYEQKVRYRLIPYLW